MAGLPRIAGDRGEVHPKSRKPPSQTWRTFLANHVPDITAIDFFAIPTLMFGVLYGFVILRHDQRRVVHFKVTAHVVLDEVFSNCRGHYRQSDNVSG